MNGERCTLLAGICAAARKKTEREKGEECEEKERQGAGKLTGGRGGGGVKKTNMFLNLPDSICNFLLHCSFLYISPWLITSWPHLASDLAVGGEGVQRERNRNSSQRAYSVGHTDHIAVLIVSSSAPRMPPAGSKLFTDLSAELLAPGVLAQTPSMTWTSLHIYLFISLKPYWEVHCIFVLQKFFPAAVKIWVCAREI